jgi:hypothetical protein
MMQDFKNYHKRTLIVALSLSLLVAFSCSEDDDDGPETVMESTVTLGTSEEIPTVMNRSETGTAKFKLNSDSSLTFDLSVSNLDATDALTMARIYTGGPVDVGAPVITLVDNSTVKFQGSTASGTVKISSTLFENLKNSGDFYVNILSTKLSLGLVRGQMNKTITYAQNVDLTPVGNSLRPETGSAILRMAQDSTLFYKVTVNNLKEGDVLASAQINVGATGVTGPSIISLYSVSADYGTAKSIKLNSSQVYFLLNSAIYVAVSSSRM